MSDWFRGYWTGLALGWIGAIVGITLGHWIWQ